MFMSSQNTANSASSFAALLTVPKKSAAHAVGAVSGQSLQAFDGGDCEQGGEVRDVPIMASFVLNDIGNISLGVSGPLFQPSQQSTQSSSSSPQKWSQYATAAAAAVGHMSIISSESKLDLGLAAVGTRSDITAACTSAVDTLKRVFASATTTASADALAPSQMQMRTQTQTQREPE